MTQQQDICTCEKREDCRMWARECPEHGEDAISAKLLPPGTAIRHARHRELTGRIHAHEYHSPGHISPIPYNIWWDNHDRAVDLLGWFSIYAGIDSVVPLETEEAQS